ncbi:MAG TPA: trimethyllysine dioxygenase [Acidimicrobiaceae bacterium]|nr:trimethyllysine dioxygenase [Acidimicrobiaceae bacterium]
MTSTASPRSSTNAHARPSRGILQPNDSTNLSRPPLEPAAFRAFTVRPRSTWSTSGEPVLGSPSWWAAGRLNYHSGMASIASLRHDDASLEVTWADGVVSRYPWLWLRDHAHDDDTMHPVTQQRQLFTARVPAGLQGLSTEIVDGELRVTWDMLEPPSALPVAFLATYRHPRVARVAVEVPVTLWNAASLITPTVPYELVMHTDAGLAQWLTNTLQFGFCLVVGTPATAAATEALMRRVGYIRETIFGGFWEFQADMSKADTAYTTLELRGHTDSTYSNDAPGCQLLHCLEFVGTGGESTMVDAFAIARRMEAEHADLFEVLSSVTVPGQYIGDGAHLMAARSVFRHDHTGRLVQVSFNNYDRAPFLLEEADMIAFYDAVRVFEELANDPAMQWRHVLQPGEAMLFDNWRVLHGRAAYTGLRRMCGGYLNREDLESRLRQLH